jgi:hypothetical protein
MEYNHYKKYMKYKEKYINLKKILEGGCDGCKEGDRVIEIDTSMTGKVIKIHNNYSVTHIVMKGDDGKIYDRNFSHFKLLKNTIDEENARKLREKREEELKIQKKKQQLSKTNGIDIGDRVIESDTSMTGRVIKFHDDYSITHIVMKGDDGKIYDRNIWHYKLLKNTIDEKNARKLREKREEELKIQKKNNNFLKLMVLI